MFRLAASFGEVGRLSSGESVPLDRSTVTGRAICDLQPVQVADLQNAGDEFPLGRELAIRHGHRTTLSVPLIREGRALGAILVRRTEVRPFEEKHIALLKAFADQAAIAIENVRLFEAEQQRTRELTESLQQQTATADVLKVISRSTFDLQTVLDTLVESAARLCAADMGIIFQPDGECFDCRATLASPAKLSGYALRAPHAGWTGAASTGRAAIGRQGQFIFRTCWPIPNTARRAIRTWSATERTLGVPLLREGTPIGVFALGRDAVEPIY